MGIGTSLGAFHEDDFRHEAAPWFLDPKDDNVIDPEVDPGGTQPLSNPVIPVALKKSFYDPQAGYSNFFNTTDGYGQTNSRGILGYDYDYSGFFTDNPDAKISPGQHYPDTYKKPNHPTFSDESKYHGPAGGYYDRNGDPTSGAEGGHWDKNEDGTYNFTPGKTNLDHHTAQELIDYFKKYEPKNKLILPIKK